MTPVNSSARKFGSRPSCRFTAGVGELHLDCKRTNKKSIAESEAAEKILAKSLKNLRTDYIDLYLLHTPFCFKASFVLFLLCLRIVVCSQKPI